MKQTEIIQLSFPVPYHAQVASRELAAQIFEEGLNPRMDPCWVESGAESPDEYAYWVERACGVACVQMCVEALGGPKISLIDWAKRGVAIGGYLIKQENDSHVEYGWIHKSLADLIIAEGFWASTQAASIDQIPGFIQQDKLVIASVSYEAGTELPITKKGGHLVVVFGVELLEGKPKDFYVHNPSGRTIELQANTRITAERFEKGFSGRIIVAGRSSL